MHDAVRHYLANYIALPDAVLDEFCQRLIPRTLKAKDYWLREGEVCRAVAFVNRGCLRYFYNTDGLERTGQFFFENTWYTDYHSFLTETPTQQSVQALERSELLLLPKAVLYDYYDRYPQFERFGRLMAEQAYLGSRQTNVGLLTTSPEERYLHLIATRPKVIERVALRYIASYLGVQPESLSRIRKRLFERSHKP